MIKKTLSSKLLQCGNSVIKALTVWDGEVCRRDVQVGGDIGKPMADSC